ncbi:hypothetical protein AWB80_04378 [Caballeronia pedi]|uniref:Flagella basal body P-ring formation protein FlgA n=1 Tax=Caballeronia pedi TaxID=1777141 RepID=A0A158C0M3_9BURK|nr:hypothetical protein [Caballeronia pedi]SAK75821.1 hypothetical protein AWB80_04378 [Caballeronia pedi]
MMPAIRQRPSARGRFSRRDTRYGHLAAVRCAVLALSALASPEKYAQNRPVEFFDRAYVTENVVRLRNVANVTALPLEWQEAAASLVVATLPERAGRLEIGVQALARTVRREMPGLTPWFQAKPDASGFVVVLRAPYLAQFATPDGEQGASKEGHACMRVKESVQAANAIRLADVEATRVSCGAGSLRRVAYARDTRLVRAVDELAPGDLIPALPVSKLAQVRRGEPMTLVASSGGVTISHRMIAQVDQPARVIAALASEAEAISTHVSVRQP